jgi:hypothetical protein
VDARNGGLEAQNAAVAGPYANGRRFATLSWGAGSGSGSASKGKVGSGSFTRLQTTGQ